MAGYGLGSITLFSGLYTAIIILVLYWFSTWITLKGGNRGRSTHAGG
jgi:hypothetical protein